MQPEASPPNAPADVFAEERPASQGRRIRWERDQADAERIIVRDAVTGKVIAVLRSLFEMGLD